ncbi:hypothetical protein GUJ93_ZPchr0005g14894 [Zizania palustris]|uniref:Uncharacterized protein n=1 Tax=Zizania palustris TaxID=103762 RepID=A0A8J5VG17_ZIZPA|nr:hypothetical protein GUJ93_ZPchr0005g14894 [Zizania palustris]
MAPRRKGSKMRCSASLGEDPPKERLRDALRCFPGQRPSEGSEAPAGIPVLDEADVPVRPFGLHFGGASPNIV